MNGIDIKLAVKEHHTSALQAELGYTRSTVTVTVSNLAVK